MTYNQLITKINDYYNKIGFNQRPSAPLIHKGFPGNFNLSLAEYEFFNQNDDFFDLKKDIVYTKNQPCIRYNDFAHIKKPNPDSYRYLLRFTMAPVGGITWKKDVTLREKEIEKCIYNLLNFLTKDCGLDIDKIHIQYLKSESIQNLTEGKYNFDFDVPDDPNLQIYKNYGIPEKNFASISNRDGLLALNVYGRPTPWGYRNEIFYEYNGKLLDIATLESLVFEPSFDETGIISGLKPYPYTLVLSAVGVERILMILNNLRDINELDIISEPAEILRPYTDPISAKQLVQVLRTIQAILSDDGQYQSLDKRRKEKMRDFFALMHTIISKNQIPTEVIAKVLGEIALLEPNLPKLSQAVNLTIEEYEFYKLRMKYIHSWQEHLDELPRYHFNNV